MPWRPLFPPTLTPGLRNMEAFSLDAWKAKSIRVLEVAEGLAIQYKAYDLLELLTTDNEFNPLLAEVFSKGSNAVQQQMKSDPTATMPKLLGLVNEIAVKVIVNPPLIEQGKEDGISVKEIPFMAKFALFQELMGGQQQLEDAKQFLEGQETSMVIAPAMPAVRPASE